MSDLSKAKTENFHLRLTANQKQRLKEISEDTKVSISSIIRYAIDRIIDNYSNESESLD